jgi:hypothetical protein
VADSPAAAALEQLLLERANLTARLAKVDDLIERMRDVFHLPALPMRSVTLSEVIATQPPRRRGRPPAAAAKEAP